MRRVPLALVARGSHPRPSSAYDVYAGRSPQLVTVPPSSSWSSAGFYRPGCGGDQKQQVASSWARTNITHVVTVRTGILRIDCLPKVPTYGLGERW